MQAVHKKTKKWNGFNTPKFMALIVLALLPVLNAWSNETESCPGLLDINKVIQDIRAADKDPNQSVQSAFMGITLESDNSTILAPTHLFEEANEGYVSGRSTAKWLAKQDDDNYMRYSFIDCKTLILRQANSEGGGVLPDVRFTIDLSRSNAKGLVLNMIPDPSLDPEVQKNQHFQHTIQLSEPGVLDFYYNMREIGRFACGDEEVVDHTTTQVQIRWGNKIPTDFGQAGEKSYMDRFSAFMLSHQSGKTNSLGCAIDNKDSKFIPTSGKCTGCAAYHPDENSNPKQKEDTGL